jgi:2-polyprenyl-6-hydroxyphenyl methylase/3-demethylubiquinone-9 3-methyltransferase
MTSTDERFAFGENWRRFLAVVDDARIDASIGALRDMLGVDDLEGKTFLDIGSGSGLSSLAARRLGAVVSSFDYDADSVACTEELHRRYDDESGWKVEPGSVLDDEYMRGLGTFDVVYSWGVLHHTGAMWRAMENASRSVGDDGQLFIALYNDQGIASRRWGSIKRRYNRSSDVGKSLLIGAVGGYFAARKLVKLGVAVLPSPPAAGAAQGSAADERGMSKWTDLVDWVGGYPFEVASPEAVVAFYRDRGFTLERLRTVGGAHGCNQYVFRRSR